MNNVIDISHFLLVHHKKIKIKSRVVACSIPWLSISKNGQKTPFHEDGKVGRSNATPIKLVDHYDLKFMSNLVMLFSLLLKWQGNRPT